MARARDSTEGETDCCQRQRTLLPFPAMQGAPARQPPLDGRWRVRAVAPQKSCIAELRRNVGRHAVLRISRSWPGPTDGALQISAPNAPRPARANAAPVAPGPRPPGIEPGRRPAREANSRPCPRARDFQRRATSSSVRSSASRSRRSIGRIAESVSSCSARRVSGVGTPERRR